jgi:hypothetical protein
MFYQLTSNRYTLLPVNLQRQLSSPLVNAVFNKFPAHKGNAFGGLALLFFFFALYIGHYGSDSQLLTVVGILEKGGFINRPTLPDVFVSARHRAILADQNAIVNDKFDDLHKSLSNVSIFQEGQHAIVNDILFRDETWVTSNVILDGNAIQYLKDAQKAAELEFRKLGFVSSEGIEEIARSGFEKGKMEMQNQVREAWTQLSLDELRRGARSGTLTALFVPANPPLPNNPLLTRKVPLCRLYQGVVEKGSGIGSRLKKQYRLVNTNRIRGSNVSHVGELVFFSKHYRRKDDSTLYSLWNLATQKGLLSSSNTTLNTAKLAEAMDRFRCHGIEKEEEYGEGIRSLAWIIDRVAVFTGFWANQLREEGCSVFRRNKDRYDILIKTWKKVDERSDEYLDQDIRGEDNGVTMTGTVALSVRSAPLIVAASFQALLGDLGDLGDMEE